MYLPEQHWDKDTQYPGKMTSKNFTANCDPILLAVPTVDSGGATQPCDVKEDNQPALMMEEEPTQGVATSSQVHRECTYSGKSICTVHRPGAKQYWKSGMKKVTDQGGMTRLEKRTIYYNSCAVWYAL